MSEREYSFELTKESGYVAICDSSGDVATVPMIPLLRALATLQSGDIDRLTFTGKFDPEAKPVPLPNQRPQGPNPFAGRARG